MITTSATAMHFSYKNVPGQTRAIELHLSEQCLSDYCLSK